MLRVLTLSTLFPTAARPTFGVFVERQSASLVRVEGIELEIVSPVGLPPWPLSLHPYYAERRRLPLSEEHKGLVVHRPRYRAWPKLGHAKAALAMARDTLPLLRRLRETFAFDIIEAEYFWPDGVAAMHLARALDVPFSITARGSDIHYWGRNREVLGQMLEAAGEADGVLAVSGALRSDMVALGMEAGKVEVQYPGIDLDLFKPADRRRAKAALEIEGPLIVGIGALIPLKGHDLTIAALDHLPAASLFIAGEGPERATLERQAARHGQRVRLLGNRPPDTLPALLAAADVMVLPSEREGLANAWLESLACGTPIVIGDAGGAREIVDRPEAGRIVARDPKAIADAITAILADPPAQEEVRKSASRFSWERNSLELAEHLRSLAATSPLSPAGRGLG